ncbi:MAG: hypothetical protein E6538_08490 [Paeniclostridium sordellii]|nr:hypothetical protein [Paeniclostridium sordellii]
MIAFECKYGRMHITMENVLVEEEENQIIVTNLVLESFPIIRYKLGDYIELDLDTKCEGGMAHPIIKNVIRRIGNLIYGKTKTYPTFTLYYIFKNMSNKDVVLNYQFIQEKKVK